MEVVLHCGIHRTGTTSLQTFLTENRESLAPQGVRYPGEKVHHQDLVWAIKRGSITVEDLFRILEAEEEKAGTVVLSGEDFSILTKLGWLKKIARIYPTRAIFYLRRQDHWVMSWYNQHIKWPFEAHKAQMDPRAFLATLDDFHWLDYATLLRRWENVLGAGNVMIGLVEKGQVENVVEDFVQRLNLNQENLSFDMRRVNDSLPIHVLEIARHLGLSKMSPVDRTRVLAALRKALADKASSASTVYSPEERRQILDRFSSSNRKVAERYFNRESLFYERPPPFDAPYFRFPEMSRQTLMREWVTPVIQELLESNGRS